MNKKTIILLASLILVVAVFFFLNKKNISTLKNKDNNFQFDNTNAISKVFLSNKKYPKNHVLLSKENNKWLVNSEFEASDVKIEILLETLKKVRVKKPVSKNYLAFVLKDLAANGTKVEIYENNSLSKVFYVGNNSGDEMGTYFYMEKGEEPYICHIPGFQGFLNSRFLTDVNAWRSHNIFACKEENIQEIEVLWTDVPKNSFKINNSGKVPEIIQNEKALENNKAINLNKLKSYLKLWENLSFEGFPINLKPKDIDSIHKTQAFLTLILTDKTGKTTSLKVHRKGIFEDTNILFDKEGNPLTYDIENFYGFINNNNKEVVQIQDFVFGKVMKTIHDFKL